MFLYVYIYPIYVYIVLGLTDMSNVRNYPRAQ